ncbi:YmdB family metallophosphoesterase [Candidatus Uhrbacteria bacterium]|nr:YmdB family metallophosphoesterase [Candidatus Uhrbacteria bacterium]
MKILFFGDVVGKIGRRALAQTLPELKATQKPDLVIANVENLAHGFGVTVDTLTELDKAGVDFFTSGNHIFDNKSYPEVFADPHFRERILRPANYPLGSPGRGQAVLPTGAGNALVINLMGRVFFKQQFDDPFRMLEAILRDQAAETLAAIVVDFHAEATSEKVCFGWHAAGRVSAVLGTHTQVATADWRLLPGGTAYVTDVGPVAGRDGVIGFQKEGPLQGFLSQMPTHFEVLEKGTTEVNGVLITVDPATRQAIAIEKIYREVTI